MDLVLHVAKAQYSCEVLCLQHTERQRQTDGLGNISSYMLSIYFCQFSLIQGIQEIRLQTCLPGAKYLHTERKTSQTCFVRLTATYTKAKKATLFIQPSNSALHH